MRIELLLDPEDADFGAIQSDLQTEIGALQGPKVRVSTERVAPPPGTLAVEEVFRFVVEHKEEIKAAAEALVFIKAFIEVVRAVIERRKPPPKGPKKSKKKPAVILIVDDRKLSLPSSADKERTFLRSLGESSSASGKKPTR